MFRKRNATFLSAAETGDLNIIRQYIQNKTVHVETKNKDSGYTALHKASFHGHLPIVQYLIQHANANVDATITIGHTALHIACQNGHFPIVQFLVQHGNANVEAMKDDEWTALHISCEKNHIEIVQYLLKHGSVNVEATTNKGSTPLYLACQEGHLTIAQCLVRHGNANVEAADNDGWTALHIACQNGHLPIVKYLKEVCGAKEDVLANDGSTPLDIAKKKNKMDVLEYLMSKIKPHLVLQTTEEQQQEQYNTTFLSAAEEGDLNIIQQYIKDKKVNVEMNDASTGWTALLYASNYGHLEIVQHLVLIANANIEATRKHKFTNNDAPLRWACEKGHLKIVQFLMQHGMANVTACNNYGWTLLHISCYRGYLEIVQWLLQYETNNVDVPNNDGYTALHFACRNGHLKIVQCMKKEGNANIEAVTNDGSTPLYIACKKNHLAIVQFLIEHGNANVEATQNDGFTPLHIACQLNHIDIVQYLIQHGNVNVQAVKNDGASPLYIACQENYLEIVQYLLKSGNIAVEATNNDGYTALHGACCNGHLQIAQFLIQEGKANVEATQNDGLTPLHIACQENHLEVVEYLIQHGNVNVEATKNGGASPLHIACQNGHFKIVQCLLQHANVNVEAKDIDNYTPLYFACSSGHLKIVQYLVEVCGANIHNRAKNDKTPFDMALSEDKKDVAQYLELVMKQASDFLWAAESGNFNTIQQYIKSKKVDVETKNYDTGWTALHFACQNSHVKIVQYLLQHGNANVNATTNDGCSALYNACNDGDVTIVLHLVEGNANVEVANENSWTPLHIACRKGHLKIVEYLIIQGHANIDATTNDGSAALHIACQNGSLPVVRYLVEDCGASMTAQTKFGDTPLDIARENDRKNVVVFLLSKIEQNVPSKTKTKFNKNQTGTDTNDTTCNNNMGKANIQKQMTKRCKEKEFLSSAETGDYNTIQNYIQDKHVDVEIKSEIGWTALHLATFQGHLNVVQLLLVQGNASVEAATKTNWKALHLATQYNHLEIVKYLILQGQANVYATTGDGISAIHIASTEGHLELVQFFVQEMSVSVNVTGKEGYTALHSACEEGHLNVAQYLIKVGGANIDATTNTGATALHIACQNGYLPIVQYLIQNENDKIIQSDRIQLSKLVNDPSLEPFSISLQYINECTNNFTSKLLGEGAFGKVYYGADKILGLQLAIKKVPLQVMDKETLDQITLSFRREISVLKRFRHPNIVILYGFNVEVGQSCQALVYEYLTHGPLSSFLTDTSGRTRLSAATRISIMYQVARSINFLHKGGVDNLLILHRDIKAGNICLTHDYTAKLIDCGLAKFVDKDNEATRKGSVSPTMLKSSGLAVFGTPGYICPVYARGNLKYNEACDMYSVGIVMTELIVGCLQSNQSLRGEQSFGDYFTRYIRDEYEETVKDGWKLLMEDADPDACWGVHNIENLCKLVIQCMTASPLKRMLSTELMDSLWEISKNEFNIEYENLTDTIEGHNINDSTKKVQQVVVDEQPPMPCVLCFKFNISTQYVSCKKGHVICVQCVELLVQKQIGKSGNGVTCDIGHCNGSFDDDALFGKISPITYNRYIIERGLQLTAERHFMEIKELLLKQQQITRHHHEKTTGLLLKQEQLTKQHHEKSIVQHCEMMKLLQNMGSVIDATTQRTLHALAYLATENIQQCPTLVWLVPSDRSAGRSAKDWIKWVKCIACQKYDLYFVCQQSYTVVQPKMEISVPRQWLIQAGPVLQLSMLLIKAGLTAVTGAPALPFPIPNLSRNAQIMMNEEFVSSLIDESTQRIMNAFEVACTQNSDLPHLESSQLLTLTGVGYELIVEKAKKLKRSQWKESMQPVMNQYGKLIWVKKEYVRDVMKTKKLDP